MGVPTTHVRKHDILDTLDHEISGQTPGTVLTATSATTFAFTTVGSSGIDLTANYDWTGNHSWAAGWEIKDGVELMSDEADAVLGVAFRHGTNNTLTESFTSTSGFPTDARYISQWYNGDPGTANNYRMRLFANGYLQPRNGLVIGVSPYDSLIEDNTFYILKTNATVAGSWQVGNFVVQPTASTNRNIRATAFVADMRAKDTFTGTGSGETSGGWFRVGLQSESVARTYSGLQAGGVFEAAYNRTGSYVAVDVSGTMTSMYARWTDSDSAGAPAKTVSKGSFLSTGYGTWNQNTIFTQFDGIRMVDCTQANGGTHRAMMIETGVRATGASQQNIYFQGGNWNTGHLQLGNAHIWFDGTTLYGKVTTPTGATDGFDMLAGGGGASADSFLEWAGL